MLERTGPGLKSCTCTLQRVLPKPATASGTVTATATTTTTTSAAAATAAVTASRRSTRRLHTGFWQHGALAHEIAGLWHVPAPPGRGALDSDFVARLRLEHELGESNLRSSPKSQLPFLSQYFSSSPPPPQPSSAASPSSSSFSTSISSSSSSSSSPTGLSASTFLLDFLYPSATRKLLQRLYPVFLRSQEGKPSSPLASPRRRHLSSASVAEETKPQPHAGFHEALDPSHARSLRRHQSLYQGRHLNKLSSKPPPSKSMSGVIMPQIAIENVPPNIAIRDARAAAQRHEAEDTLGAARLSRTPSDLPDLLSLKTEKQYNAVWVAFCRLKEQEQLQFRRDVILHLSSSPGIVDIGRALSLFRQVSVEEWDDDLLAAGVSLLLRSGDLKYAIDRYRTGLNGRGLTGGLEPILHHTVIHRKWPALIPVWLQFYASQPPEDADSKANGSLEQLGSLPDLEALYFSLEHFLLTDGARSLRAINSSERTRLGLGALRRKLASLAIAQSSQPKQAAAILDMCGDHLLYHDYLLQAVTQWPENHKNSSASWLADIYRTFSGLPGAKPSVPLLQGMFDLFYPHNVAGLEQVYKDWHRAWGDLDQWGYEKFLKLYAHAGDVQAVRGLWKRYVARYPKLLQKPRAFRSTMNVYAQVGDAAGAERELRFMTHKYGVRADLDTWNILLKCYVRTDNYQRVVACFEELCRMFRPDSYSYAHVMTMAAKKGDLDATLAYFNRAQRDKVGLSKEIAMSLVTVCCQNDRLLDAERILTELAARGITSTAIWNQLLHFHGRQGRLRKCYELLQLMKGYGVLWDHQTHEFLLQALVRVNQVQPAYRLLRSAVRDKVFPVGPEHFAIVMAGAARTGEFALVESIATQLARAHEAPDFNAHAALMQASLRRAPSARRTREMGSKFIQLLRTLRDGRRGGSASTAASVAPMPGDLRYLRKQTKHIGTAIRLLVELRDFSAAEELVGLYASVLRKHSEDEPFPPEVASALMLGYLRDRQFKQVLRMWDLTLDGALTRSSRPTSPSSTSPTASAINTSPTNPSSTTSSATTTTSTPPSPGIYPAHQYDLSRPLSIAAQAFRATRNGEALRDTIRRLTLAGFKLTRHNWNTTIQYLAELGQWEPAMDWCERMLMPRWRGWAPPRRSLHERRLLRNSRALHASRAAVLSLQRQWLRLRKLAAWSPVVSAKLAQVEKLYPRLHHAFVSIDYAHLFSSRGITSAHMDNHADPLSPCGPSLRKGAADLLKPFSHKELRAMEKALVRRRSDDRRARLLRKSHHAAQPTASSCRRPNTQDQTPHSPQTQHSRAKSRARHANAVAADPQTITIAIP